MAYGANGQWHFIPMTASSVACTDQTFGDPTPGIAKNCFYSISNGGERVGPTNYILCANEGEHCSFQGAAVIAYGTNGTFAYHEATGGFDCNNALGDPTPGLIKACYYLETFAGGSHIYYQHQDYLGTERYRTNANGGPESFFYSNAYGDGQGGGGTDINSNHYGMLDADGNFAPAANGLHHATFREYSADQGRWMSPDPYSGSYDFGNPQSFNRYGYINGSPMSGIDPTGQVMLAGGSSSSGGGGIYGIIGEAIADVFDALFSSLLGGPSFEGSLEQRPQDVERMQVNVYAHPYGQAATGHFKLSGVVSFLSDFAPHNRTPNKITCGTVLPNGRTVGSYVQQYRSQLQNISDASGVDDQQIGSRTGAFYSISQSNGPIDFKNIFRGQARPIFIRV